MKQKSRHILNVSPPLFVILLFSVLIRPVHVRTDLSRLGHACIFRAVVNCVTYQQRSKICPFPDVLFRNPLFLISSSLMAL
jgi:hypothetical protein